MNKNYMDRRRGINRGVVRPTRVTERESINIAGFIARGKYRDGKDFEVEAKKLADVQAEVKLNEPHLKMDTIQYFVKNRLGTEKEVDAQMPAEESKFDKRFGYLRLIEKYDRVINTEYKMSLDERGAFLESIRGYQNYGSAIYRTDELARTVNEIAQLIETAGNFTLDETDGWFDNVTANRHTKQMKEALKVLQTEAKEIMQRQQRLEAAYEDIGQLLGRYYDV